MGIQILVLFFIVPLKCILNQYTINVDKINNIKRFIWFGFMAYQPLLVIQCQILFLLSY